MSNTYTIKFTDPQVDPQNKQPFVIPQGAWDRSTSLTLPGHSASWYGEHIADNFVHMLENFASETQPLNPTVGQLWYVPSLRAVKVLIRINTDGGVKTYVWRTVGAIATTTEPPEDTTGLWYDTSNASPLEWQLKIYNSGTSAWTSVADRYVKKAGDVITGSLIVGTPSDVGLSSSAGGFFPNTTQGVVVTSVTDAVVQIGDAGAFAVSTGSALDGSDRNDLLGISATGEVHIRRGNLIVHGNKINEVAAGVAETDAVNVGQLAGLDTSLKAAIKDLEDRKVNRVGDTMTGQLVIASSGVLYPGTSTVNPLVIDSDDNGIVIHSRSTVNSLAINVTNPYGTSGVQSVFWVKSFTGDVTTVGNLDVYKAVNVGGTLTVRLQTTLNAISSMVVPVTSIVDAKHLTTKEYVDAKVAASVSTEVFARVNPATPRTGDILCSDNKIFINYNGWKQVFPAQWAP